MSKYSIEKIGLRYGVYAAVAYILFFIIMQVVGLAHFYWLRALNYVFLFSAVFMAIKNYKNAHKDTFAYLNGIGVGVVTSVISCLIFAVFLCIYLEAINPDFMAAIKENEMFGQYLNPYIAAAAILFEGSFSGIATAFILMPYFKKSHADETGQMVP